MVRIKMITSSGQVPEYETEGSAGMDIRAFISGDITLHPGERALVPTGLRIELPAGYEAQLRSRSGLAINHGIALINGIGTIDSDYRGEIKVALINLSDSDFVIKSGDRIAQMVVTSYEKVSWQLSDSLTDSDRGEGGFGHTGK